MLAGNPLIDIALFVWVCADAEVRRECGHEIFNRYYDRLAENYAKRGAKLEFSRKEVRKFAEAPTLKFRAPFQAFMLYEIAIVHQIFLFIIFFSGIGIPALETEDGADRARGEKLKLRLLLAAADAAPLLEKYEFEKRFPRAL